jgi:predicted RNA-binding protein with PUA-like domain
VDLKPVKTLKRPVTLVEIKAAPEFENMELVKNSRLSVQKVTPEEWKLVMKMSGGK